MKILFSCFSLALLVLVLLCEGADAHHVYGIEVSPAFELFHGLAEPLLFALSGASLAAFLARRTPVRLWATLALGGAAIALALASVIEEGAGAFLLWNAVAGALFYALAKRRLRARRNSERL